MAGIYNGWIIEQGATFSQEFIWESSPNVPMDLDGYTARMQIRPNQGDPVEYITLTTENQGIILGYDGVVELFIADDVTTDFSWRKAVYDLEMIEPGGNVIRLLQGTIICSPEVTEYGYA